MTKIAGILLSAVLALAPGFAAAQSSPGFVNGVIITNTQLNKAFEQKQDVNLVPPCAFSPCPPSTAIVPNSVLFSDGFSHLFFGRTLPSGLTLPAPILTGPVGIGTAAPNATLSVSTTGLPLSGAAMSTVFNTNAGTLGATAGNTLAVGSLGFLSSNQTALGIRAQRTANGTDWTTTAIGLGIDVDATSFAGGAQLWFNGNGNIGIGTNLPDSKLTLGNATAKDMLHIDMQPTGSGESHILLSAGGVISGRLRTASAAGSFNPMVLLGDTSLVFNGTSGLQDTGGLFLGPGSSSAKGMRIDGATGNVGIGTSSPMALLDISSSTAGINDELRLSYTSNSGAAGATIKFIAGSAATTAGTITNGFDGSHFYLGLSTLNGEVARFVNGNAGIGTSTPPAKLSVGGGLQTPQSGFGVNEADVWTSIYNSPTTNAGTIQVTSGGSASAIGSTGYVLSLNPNGGNVGIGIGTGTPGALLSIANGANDPGTYGRAIQITNANGNRQQMAFIRNGNNVISAGYNGASAVWGFGTGNTTDAIFTPNFLAIDQANTRIGINTIAPNFTLDVVGDINTSSMYRVGGSQIAAANLSNGTTGSGAVALAVSPALTGSPTAPTQTAADSSTKIATTAFVHSITGGVSTVKITVFTASGTYTPTANLLYADVVCVGGGGGGGGTVSGPASTFVTAGGGGSGGVSRVSLSAAAIGASQTVTIGAGGTIGAAGNNAGGNGGDTSLGTLCVGKGGTGGAGQSGSDQGGASAGGVIGTGDETFAGQTGIGRVASSAVFAYGGGGNTPLGYGFGGQSGVITGVGFDAQGRGGGGAGGKSFNGAAAEAGGLGSQGYIVVTEYIHS